jgi:Uma2 family endonuclease
MATTQLDQPPVREPSTRPPRLENGDRLTRAEFERRYEAMADVKKAELIEGVVHMPSPVRTAAHSEPHACIVTWLGLYSAATPGVRHGDNATVRLDLDNEPQPDALLRIEEAFGGRARLSPDDYISGPPELVVEVASSSVSIDRHDKFHVYRRNGVLEYLIWQVLDRRVEWFVLEEDQYTLLAPDERGIIHSRIFPGLRLAVDALLKGDLAAVLAEQQAALDTAEHRQFVASLAARSRR